MIIKGGSRGGPIQLAMHLQRRDTNERVEVLELQSPAPNLTEALRDWQILSEGTRGTKGLYHANIDPAKDYVMTPEQWQRAVEVLEHELGFVGQPRAIVMHEKHGRQHIHVVWARTDIDTMTLRTDSKNYPSHERASLRLELEFGHEIVPGKHTKRNRKIQPEFPRAKMTHAEWQQSQRTGIDPAEFSKFISGLKQASDNAQAFKAALDEHGFLLANGNQRGFVIVDEQGEVYSLSRQLHMKSAEYKQFMKSIDRDKLPTVVQAKEMQEHLKLEPAPEKIEPEKLQSEKQEPAAQSAEPAPDRAAEEVEKIKTDAAERQAKEIQRLTDLHTHELGITESRLTDLNRQKTDAFLADQRFGMHALKDRLREETSGMKGFVRAVRLRMNPKAAAEKKNQRRREIAQLKRRQVKELKNFVELLEKTKQLEIENLKQRQELTVSDYLTRSNEEIDRYIREHEAAEKLLIEIEEHQRMLEEKRTRDGPDWPPPLTR